MNETDRAHCAAFAGLLRAAAGCVGGWGLGLTAIAALALALEVGTLSMTATMGFGAVAVLGVLERYFALRLRFDQQLFARLADGAIASLGALDTALARLALRPAPTGARTLADRIAGTRVLMQRHGIVVACQSAMFLLALMTQDLP